MLCLHVFPKVCTTQEELCFTKPPFSCSGHRVFCVVGWLHGVDGGFGGERGTREQIPAKQRGSDGTIY